MSQTLKILVIEDYPPMLKSIAGGLREAGFSVSTATDGATGLRLARSVRRDLIVLDLMLPRVDGLSILRQLRADRNPVPVLVLTAKDTLEDRVRGLDFGADDYLVKPFAFEELLARVRALLRRSDGEKSASIRIADLEIDTAACSVKRAGTTIELTAREYRLLEFLALRANRIVTRTQIWDQLYDHAEEVNSNVIDVYVGYLRRKLEQDGRSRLIRTRRGMGYILGEPD